MGGIEGYEGFGHLSCPPVLLREPVGDEPSTDEAGHDVLAAEH